MKKIIGAFLALALVLASGCSTISTGTKAASGGQSAQSGKSASGQKTIGLSTKTITNNEFQRVVVEAAQKTVEAAGYKFVLTLAGDEMAVATQVNNIEDLINKHVDGIIIMPMDGQAVLPAMKKAKEAGIPVVVADEGVADGNEDLYVTHVGTDNYAAGKKAAEEMIKKIGQGDVVTVRGLSGAVSGEQRASGFKDGLKGSKVKLVNEQAGNWQSDVAMQATENMLTSNPEIKGLFNCSDGMLPGVISAISNAGKTSQVNIITVDGEKKALQEISAGKCYGDVMQYPEKIGTLSAQTLIGVLNGSVKTASVKKFTDAGFLFASTANMQEALKFGF